MRRGAIQTCARAPSDIARARWSTERRRLLNPLWRALDTHLRPKLAEGVLLCVSGGDDSMALLESVARWPKRGLGEIQVASVDHGHRIEGRAESDAVCARARVLGFEAHSLSIQTATTSEGSLRNARYRCLEKCAREAGLGALVTAHHLSDRSEARLLSQLSEFSLAEMVSSSDHDPRRIKPFWDVPRRVLLSAPFAPFSVHDAFDEAGGGARGEYRTRLEPTLEGIFPDFEVHLRRATHNSALGQDYIRQETRRRLRFKQGWAELDLPVHPALIHASLSLVCAKFGTTTRFRQRAFAEVVSFCKASPISKREGQVSLQMAWGDLRLEVRKNILFFSLRVLPSA